MTGVKLYQRETRNTDNKVREPGVNKKSKILGKNCRAGVKRVNLKVNSGSLKDYRTQGITQ